PSKLIKILSVEKPKPADSDKLRPHTPRVASAKGDEGDRETGLKGGKGRGAKGKGKGGKVEGDGEGAREASGASQAAAKPNVLTEAQDVGKPTKGQSEEVQRPAKGRGRARGGGGRGGGVDAEKDGAAGGGPPVVVEGEASSGQTTKRAAEGKGKGRNKPRPRNKGGEGTAGIASESAN
ncbi:MAG: hypothetical protein SGPRY_005103, partial [Prymnesium sp.]